MKAIKRFLKNVQREILKTDLERYLEGSRDLADLEHRTRMWMSKKPFIQAKHYKHF